MTSEKHITELINRLKERLKDDCITFTLETYLRGQIDAFELSLQLIISERERKELENEICNKM